MVSALAGQHALVSGGGRGIGRTIASALRQAGARVDSVDPLAVLAFGKAQSETTMPDAAGEAPEGTVPVPAPMQGTIVSIAVKEGDAVDAGQALLVCSG